MNGAIAKVVVLLELPQTADVDAESDGAFAPHQLQIVNELVRPALRRGFVLAVAGAVVAVLGADIGKRIKGWHVRSVGKAEVRLQIGSISSLWDGPEEQVAIANTHGVDGVGAEDALPIQAEKLRRGRVYRP